MLALQREGADPIPVAKKGANLLFMSRFVKVGGKGMMYALISCEKRLEEDGDVLVEL